MIHRRQRSLPPDSCLSALAACAAATALAVPGCQIARRKAAAPVAATPISEDSRSTALFAGDPAAQQPAPGVIPYDINSALFSDYAEKFRFIKLPAGCERRLQVRRRL